MSYYQLRTVQDDVPNAVYTLSPYQGVNADVGTTFEDIWREGGVRVIPTAEDTISVVSTSADDVADTGTGAWVVMFPYIKLAADGKYTDPTPEPDQYLQYELNGLTDVTTDINSDTNVGLIVDRAFIRQVGTGGTNAGDIKIKVGSDVVCTIGAGKGIAEMAMGSIPRADGWKLGVNQIKPNIGTVVNNQIITIELQARENGFAWHTYHSIIVDNFHSAQAHTFDPPLALPGADDVRVQAKTSTGAAQVSVSIDFFIYK